MRSRDHLCSTSPLSETARVAVVLLSSLLPAAHALYARCYSPLPLAVAIFGQILLLGLLFTVSTAFYPFILQESSFVGGDGDDRRVVGMIE